MIQQKTKTNISMAVLLLVAAAWGLGYTCVGDALNNGWSNIGIFCFRGLIGGTLCMGLQVRLLLGAPLDNKRSI